MKNQKSNINPSTIAQGDGEQSRTIKYQKLNQRPKILAFNFKLGFALCVLIFTLLTLNLAKANAQTTVDASKYIQNEHLPINPINAPADLVQKLETEINKMIADQNGDGQYDHLAPFVLNNQGMVDKRVPAEGGYVIDTSSGAGRSSMGVEAYFFNPGETIYALAQAYPYVSSATKQKIKTFINLEITRYPPLTFGFCCVDPPALAQGVTRTAYSARSSNTWPPYSTPLENVYALWNWARVLELEGDNSGWDYMTNNWTQINNLYQNNPPSQPNFKAAIASGRIPYYGDLAGLIGVARVAQKLNQTAVATDATNLATTLMQSGINFDTWRQNLDSDIRTILSGDRMEPFVPIFTWLVPEVGLYLQENVETQPGQPVKTYLDGLTVTGTDFGWLNPLPVPNWYQAWVERQTGGENDIMSPQFGQPIFLAKAYVLGENQQQLRSYLHYPWALGDLYYLQKIVATIEAPTVGGPTPTPAPSCTLTSASWDAPGGASSVVEGTSVSLNVVGNSACDGQQVSFTVMENDTILEGIGDDPVTTNPVNVTFKGTSATGAWISEWQSDCAGLCNPPEYYFVASVGTSTLRSADPLLTVTQAITPTPTPTPGPISGNDWPQLQHDASHSGITSQGVVGPFREKWRFNQVPISGRVQPIVVAGKVFIGSNNGKMYALDGNTGSILWEYQTGGMIVDSTAYSYTTGYVYFGSTDNYVYALEANTGALKWKKLTGGTVRTAPVIAYNRVYLGSSDGVMHAYNEATGNEDWSFTTDNNAAILETAVAADNSIFFGDKGAKAYALDANTGAFKWKQQLTGQSMRDRWPVAIKSASGTKIIFTTVPSYQFHQLLRRGTSLLYNNWDTDWPTQKALIINLLATNPYDRSLHVLNAITGILDTNTPILYTGGTNTSHTPPIGTNDFDTKVIYRYTERVNPQADGVGLGATTSGLWGLYLGQWNLSTQDITNLDSWGSSSSTYDSSVKAFIINDETNIISQGGNNLYSVDSSRGLSYLDLTSKKMYGIATNGIANTDYPYYNINSLTIFRNCKVAGGFGCSNNGPKGEGLILRPVVIANGLIFYQLGSTLVAIEGTVQ